MPHKTFRKKKEVVRLRNKKTGKVITLRLKSKKRMRLPRFRNMATTGTKKIMGMLASIRKRSVI